MHCLTPLVFGGSLNCISACLVFYYLCSHHQVVVWCRPCAENRIAQEDFSSSQKFMLPLWWQNLSTRRKLVTCVTLAMWGHCDWLRAGGKDEPPLNVSFFHKISVRQWLSPRGKLRSPRFGHNQLAYLACQHRQHLFNETPRVMWTEEEGQSPEGKAVATFLQINNFWLYSGNAASQQWRFMGLQWKSIKLIEKEKSKQCDAVRSASSVRFIWSVY